MGFSVTVYRKVDREFLSNSPDPSSAEFDVWLDECRRRKLFDASIGDGGTIGDLWSLPAKGLKLNHLSRLYDDGLVVQDDALDELTAEMQALERHWIATVDHKKTRTHKIVGYGVKLELSVAFLHDLMDAAEAVQAAARIARLCDGYLIMS